MRFEFHGSYLTDCDYFGSVAFTRGEAWATVRERQWHIMLPRFPRSCHVVQAGLIEDPDEPGGWSWCLDLDEELFPLPQRQIYGERPLPPDRGGYWQRRGLLYTAPSHNANRAAFGGVHELRSGLVGRPHTLWLTHGMRVDYRARP